MTKKRDWLSLLGSSPVFSLPVATAYELFGLCVPLLSLIYGLGQTGVLLIAWWLTLLSIIVSLVTLFVTPAYRPGLIGIRLSIVLCYVAVALGTASTILFGVFSIGIPSKNDVTVSLLALIGLALASVGHCMLFYKLDRRRRETGANYKPKRINPLWQGFIAGMAALLTLSVGALTGKWNVVLGPSSHLDNLLWVLGTLVAVAGLTLGMLSLLRSRLDNG